MPQRFDHFMDPRYLASLHNMLECHARGRGDEVGVDGSGEEHGLLRYDAEVRRHLSGCQVAYVRAANADAAAGRSVQAQHEFFRSSHQQGNLRPHPAFRINCPSTCSSFENRPSHLSPLAQVITPAPSFKPSRH